MIAYERALHIYAGLCRAVNAGAPPDPAHVESVSLVMDTNTVRLVVVVDDDVPAIYECRRAPHGLV